MKIIAPPILSIEQLSSLLGTSFTQAPQACRYIVLELGGLEPETIFGLKNADVYPVDGSIDTTIMPTRHNGASRIAIFPALLQAWLPLFAGGNPENRFIALSQEDLFRQLSEIRKRLGIGLTDTTMRRTSFIVLLSHGMPCPDCIHSLGFGSSFPTRAGERETFPFGAWRRLLPEIVLSKKIHRCHV